MTLDSTVGPVAAPPEGVTSLRIATALKDAILSGDIAPGEWLR